MRRALMCVALWLAGATASYAIINPNFTPKQLVAQADLIVAGKLKATGKPLDWAFVTEKTIKGVALGQATLSLTGCSKDHLDDFARILKASSDEAGPALLFAITLNREKRPFLHIAGHWLEVRQGAGNCWGVVGPASHLSGTYAGGTDMLIRMADHLTREPDAFVPVHAGIRWFSHIKVGQIDGQVAGVEVAEIGEPRRPHLFVASSAGDRLFAPKRDEEAFEDVTARVGLDARSRVFLWLDVSRDGLADSPGLNLRLSRGVTGPVTASCWAQPKSRKCTGAVSVAGHSPGSYVAVRSPGEVTIRYRLPGKPEQTQTVTVADGPKEVILTSKGTE